MPSPGTVRLHAERPAQGGSRIGRFQVWRSPATPPALADRTAGASARNGKTGPQSAGSVGSAGLPNGFDREADFVLFGATLCERLARIGHGNTEPVLQGSAVTGASFNEGRPFGPQSDFDIALVSGDLMNRAIENGVEFRSGGGRTAPLTTRQQHQLGLRQIAIDLSRLAGREVNFMIFQTMNEAMERPGISLRPGRPQAASADEKKTDLALSDAGWPSLA